jgi:DNA polymerase bacteriophage-type
MTNAHHRCVIDIETGSCADLPRIGADAYAEDATTRVLCLAYQLDDNPIKLWWPGQPPPFTNTDPAITWVAHNAGFEIAIWQNILEVDHGWPGCPPAYEWSCTMARSSYHGLPAALDDVAIALRLPNEYRKDAAGRRIMMQCMRPRSLIPTMRWWHEDDPAKFDALCRYCVRDVEIEAKLDRMLPELPHTEKQLWLINHRVNQTGVILDTDLIDRMQRIVDQETMRLNAEIKRLTEGLVASVNQVGKMREFLELFEGVKLDSLDKDSVAQILGTHKGLTVVAERILRIRAEAAKTSTAKLVAMKRALSSDGVARGLFRYYGASRTGRYSSQRIQLQNLARPTIKKPAAAIELIQRDVDVPGLRMLFEDTPLGVISSCLRGCIIPRPGYLFALADASQIEARIIAWLADQQDVLDVFANPKEDIYTWTAAQAGSSIRQLGKVIRLALGFGMGWRKFIETAASYGVTLDELQAMDIVDGFRAASPSIVEFWYELQTAAMNVARAPHGYRETVGFISLERRRKAMVMILPSGRELFYQYVAVAWDQDRGRYRLTYEGMNQYTRRWEKIATWGGKLAENATQAAARDVLTDALLVVVRMGLEVIGTVHDEIIVESPAADADRDLQKMLMVMKRMPWWAPGLPVGAEGKVVARYGK